MFAPPKLEEWYGAQLYILRKSKNTNKSVNIMERSFNNSLFGSSKSTGISRSRQSLGGSLFSSSSKKGGLPASKKGSGRYSLSTKSNLSSLQIVARSEYNIVECYGLPLPVQVKEILTFSDKSAHVSVNYSANGWAWAVCGRKLLVWQYKESFKNAENYQQQSSRRAITSQCRLLTLPHCDIGHKATLISVFIADDHQMASCLAVSPTGDVRYWPSIAHDGSSIDEYNILDGQEFEEIVSITPQIYMLVTTTCHLVQLQIQVHNGRQTIIHKVIKPPSGFLGGIGRKFASIIIGLNSHNEKESKLIKICSEKISNKEWHITILADKWLQRWSVSPSVPEQFLCEDLEVMKKIREMYQQKFWTNRDITEIQLWLLDMQSTDRGVIILAAAINEQHTPNVIYTLVTMVAENDSMVIKETNLVKYKGFYSKEREGENLNLKFVANRGVAYIYNTKVIYPVILNNVQNIGGDDIEKIEFHAQHDGIMYAGCHQNIPLFFSRLHGFVCITPSDFDPTEIFNTSVSGDVFNASVTTQMNDSILSPSTTNVGNLLMYELDPDEIYGEDKEMSNVIKAAFIYHLKRNSASCSEIVKDIAPGTELDETIVRITQDLAEDLPAADPRWEMVNKSALGSSTSMQIVQQLREKSKAMLQFVEFLHEVNLWEKLGSINDRSVCHILSDTAEKIVAAIALKCIHNSHTRIIDEAIERTISEVNILMPTGNLTNHDVFYVQINHIHEFFKALSDLIEKYVNEEYTTNQIQSALIEVNTIILTMIGEIMKFRCQNVSIFTLSEEKAKQFEYLPWTAATGKFGLRDVLLHMIACTLKYGIKTSGEPEFRQRHYTQMAELVDLILDGRKKYLDSIKDSGKYNVLFQQYESQRSDLIFPLVEGEQYELAAKVAEKYLDFQTLVVICDRTNNQQRLDEYIERYKEMDFSQFAITWHMRQNKQGDIFSRFKGNQAALAKFLTDHPSLAWIQHVFNGELLQAAEVLYFLAMDEKELITRKRIMLSLSKLCALACEGDMKEQITEINREMQLIEIQEQLPLEVLAIFGYDTKHPKVLTPEEIVDLFIAEENENATEHEFRKALELLQFVPDDETTRHKIWCAAILRDSWSNYNMNSPWDDMQNMLFFRLIDVCYIFDEKLETFLPPVDSFLMAPELGELTQSKSFQYLIKLGYEHILESHK